MSRLNLRQQIAYAQHQTALAERHARIMDRAYLATFDPDCVKAALIAIWPNPVIPDLDREASIFLSVLAAKIQEKVHASGVQAEVTPDAAAEGER